MGENTQQTKRKLRRWTVTEKARIVRRHLQEKVSLADPGERHRSLDMRQVVNATPGEGLALNRPV